MSVSSQFSHFSADCIPPVLQSVVTFHVLPREVEIHFEIIDTDVISPTVYFKIQLRTKQRWYYVWCKRLEKYDNYIE